MDPPPAGGPRGLSRVATGKYPQIGDYMTERVGQESALCLFPHGAPNWKPAISSQWRPLTVNQIGHDIHYRGGQLKN